MTISVENSLYKIGTGKKPEKFNTKELEDIYSASIDHRVRNEFLQNFYHSPFKIIAHEINEKVENREIEFYDQIKKINNLNIDYLLIKGIVTEKYYPKKIKRQQYDYDLIVKNIDDYWTLINFLFDNGYEYHYMPMFGTQKSNIYGVCKLSKNLGNNIISFFEINIKGFRASTTLWIDYEEIALNSETLLYKSVKIPVPNDNYNFLILIAEAGGNKKFRIRDFIDFNFIKKNGMIDHNFINKKLEEYHLLNDYKDILNIHKSLEKSDENLKLKSRKIKRFIFHDTVNLLESKQKIKSFYYYFVKMIGDIFIEKNHILKTLKNIEKYSLNLENKFNSEGVVYLIPLNDEFHGKWMWYKFNEYYVVRTPIGMFLASLFVIFETEEIELINKLVESHFRD